MQPRQSTLAFRWPKGLRTLGWPDPPMTFGLRGSLAIAPMSNCLSVLRTAVGSRSREGHGPCSLSAARPWMPVGWPRLLCGPLPGFRHGEGAVRQEGVCPLNVAVISRTERAR